MERNKILSAVHLLLTKDEKLLFSLRKNTGFCDGDYSLVAGHIDHNESAKKAMAREAKEEISIEIDHNDLEIIHVMHRKSDDSERIDFFMTPKKWKGEIKNAEPHKCGELIWLEKEKAPQNLVPYVKEALKNIKMNKFYSEFGW